MKLSNPHDTRTFREFKNSIIRYSSIHAPTLFLRERNRQKASRPANADQIINMHNQGRRTTLNPNKCEVMKKMGPQAQLKAAINCSMCGPYRFVSIHDLFGASGSRPQRIHCA